MIVVASVAVDQLSGDPEIAVWADRIGSAIVILVTLHAAYELIRSALPDLLDRTLAEPLQLRINRVLAECFDDYDSIEWCRSRQSGSNIEIDIGLGFPGQRAFGEVRRRGPRHRRTDRSRDSGQRGDRDASARGAAGRSLRLLSARRERVHPHTFAPRVRMGRPARNASTSSSAWP